MDPIFLTGIIGSLFLLAGAAWKNPKKGQHPAKALKNQFFAIGNILVFLYAVLSYLQGEPVFYVFFESLTLISTALMLLNANDRWASIGVGLAGSGFLAWSLVLFEDSTTILFILGLTLVAIGFILKNNLKRNLTLAVGSGFISAYSYLGDSSIFFWLNLFFCVFSLLHVVKAWRRA